MSLQKSLAKVQKWKKDLTPQTKLARRAWCTIGYQHWGSKESKDITDDISKYLLDVTFTDNLSGTVDDVAISLEDRGRLWVGDWYPVKGSLLEVAINTVAWEKLGDEQFTLPLKVSTEQLIIFDDYKYENVKPKVIIRRPGGQYQPVQTKEGEQPPLIITRALSYSYKSKTREVYRACHVKYTNKDKKTVIEDTFEDHDRKGHTYLAVLEVNEQVKDKAEAKRLAKKKLREANKEADTMSFSFPGNPLIMASVTVKLEGFGVFDGNYLITKATHTLGANYSTSIDVRRCLNGY